MSAGFRHSPPLLLATLGLSLMLSGFAGCATVRASNNRTWASDQTLLASADIDGDNVRIKNVRNCSYSSAEDYELRYYNKTFDLADIRTVDFIVVPFADMPQVAHVMLSFGFENEAGEQDFVAISVEIRREKGEQYSPIKGFMKEYELMYIVADERDVVQLRAIHRLDDVHIYRTKTSPDQARALFVDMLKRANKLTKEPEFYNTLTNNCTTNVVNHINKLWPSRVAYNFQVLLPGYSDRLAYSLGLLDTTKSFEETKAAARVNRLAYIHRESPEFSAKIRANSETLWR